MEVRTRQKFIATFVCFIGLNFSGTETAILPQSVPKKTCIIGAGISGLATARYLKQYGVNNFVVLEASPGVGGTWRFDPHVGVDDNGTPVYTSQYKYLRTNTPRQTMEFGGFPFPEDTPSYPSGVCFYRYLQSFIKNFGLMKYIQLNSLVTAVHRRHGRWEITYTKTDTKEELMETCDNVVVANGFYGKVKMPELRGQELFRGKILHSHDYKQPEDYAGLKVMVIGSGASGLDLATHLVHHAARLVHSHHLDYNQPEFPSNFVRKPDVKELTPHGAVFKDGSYEELDVIICATGYTMDKSMIGADAGLTIAEKFVLPLYQHIVNIRYPSMYFIGVAKVTITRLNDVQAEYAAAAIAGRFTLPPPERMLRDWIAHVYHLNSLGRRIVDVNWIGNMQDQYFGNLTEEAGIRRAAPVLTTIRDFNAVNRLEDLLNYRDYDYKVVDDFTYERHYRPGRNDSCPVDV